MLRKAALQAAVTVLLAGMAFNAYLAISHFKRIQRSAQLGQQSSSNAATLAAILQDLTDMETGQRGFLLTEENSYLQPYAVAKGRISGEFARLRASFANRAEKERALEAQLESLAASKQSEMERTITLRQQGYRHRAFVLVNTNEGQGYMEQARGILSALTSMEGESLSAIERQKNAETSKASSETILASLVLLVFAGCLFGLMRYHERALERASVQSERTLSARDKQLERLTSALSDKTRSEIAIIEQNVRLLLEKYEGFLPREGRAYAEQIKEAAAQIERIRRELVGRPVISIEEKAA